MLIRALQTRFNAKLADRITPRCAPPCENLAPSPNVLGDALDTETPVSTESDPSTRLNVTRNNRTVSQRSHAVETAENKAANHSVPVPFSFAARPKQYFDPCYGNYSSKNVTKQCNQSPPNPDHFMPARNTRVAASTPCAKDISVGSPVAVLANAVPNTIPHKPVYTNMSLCNRTKVAQNNDISSGSSHDHSLKPTLRPTRKPVAATVARAMPTRRPTLRKRGDGRTITGSSHGAVLRRALINVNKTEKKSSKVGIEDGHKVKQLMKPHVVIADRQKWTPAVKMTPNGLSKVPLSSPPPEFIFN